MKDIALTKNQFLAIAIFVFILFLPQLLLVFGVSGKLVSVLTSPIGFIAYFFSVIFVSAVVLPFMPKKLNTELEIKPEQEIQKNSNWLLWVLFAGINLVIVLIIALGKWSN